MCEIWAQRINPLVWCLKSRAGRTAKLSRATQHLFCPVWSLFCRTVRTQTRPWHPQSSLGMGKKLHSEVFLRLLSAVSAPGPPGRALGVPALFALREPHTPVSSLERLLGGSRQPEPARVCPPGHSGLCKGEDRNHRGCSTGSGLFFSKTGEILEWLSFPSSPRAPADGQGFIPGYSPPGKRDVYPSCTHSAPWPGPLGVSLSWGSRLAAPGHSRQVEMLKVVKSEQF